MTDDPMTRTEAQGIVPLSMRPRRAVVRRDRSEAACHRLALVVTAPGDLGVHRTDVEHLSRALDAAGLLVGSSTRQNTWSTASDIAGRRYRDRVQHATAIDVSPPRRCAVLDVHCGGDHFPSQAAVTPPVTLRSRSGCVDARLRAGDRGRRARRPDRRRRRTRALGLDCEQSGRSLGGACEHPPVRKPGATALG